MSMGSLCLNGCLGWSRWLMAWWTLPPEIKRKKVSVSNKTWNKSVFTWNSSSHNRFETFVPIHFISHITNEPVGLQQTILSRYTSASSIFPMVHCYARWRVIHWISKRILYLWGEDNRFCDILESVCGSIIVCFSLALRSDW